MKFILADTELELIPPLLYGDAEVEEICEKLGKRPEDTILDYFHFGKVIDRVFPNQNNRIGRIYIPYLFTRISEETASDGSMGKDYVIHTRGGIIIEREKIKDFVDFMTFKEGLEKILVHSNKRVPIKKYLASLRDQEILVLDPKGKPVQMIGKDTTVVMGGFAEGDYYSDLGDYERVSIYPKELTVPATLELLHFMQFTLSGLP